MRGSTEEHHLWVRPYFSSSVPHILFTWFGWFSIGAVSGCTVAVFWKVTSPTDVKWRHSDSKNFFFFKKWLCSVHSAFFRCFSNSISTLLTLMRQIHHLYIYIYIYMCVCVCVCGLTKVIKLIGIFLFLFLFLLFSTSFDVMSSSREKLFKTSQKLFSVKTFLLTKT